MIEMSELYKLQTFNAWIKSNYAKAQHNDHFVLKIETDHAKFTLKDLDQLKEKIYRLELRLTAEQLVVAY